MRALSVLALGAVISGCAKPVQQKRPDVDLAKILAGVPDSIPRPKTKSSVTEDFPSVVIPGRGWKSLTTVDFQARLPIGAESTGKRDQFRIGKAFIFAWLFRGPATAADLAHFVDASRKDDPVKSFRKANGWVGFFESDDSAKISSSIYHLLKPGLSLSIGVSWPTGNEAAKKEGMEAANMVAWTIEGF